MNLTKNDEVVTSEIFLTRPVLDRFWTGFMTAAKPKVYVQHKYFWCAVQIPAAVFRGVCVCVKVFPSTACCFEKILYNLGRFRLTFGTKHLRNIEKRVVGQRLG